MKAYLLLTTAFVLLAPSAFALNDSNNATGSAQIVDTSGNGNNVHVNAVPGAGGSYSPTTTTNNTFTPNNADVNTLVSAPVSAARSGDSTSAVTGSGNSANRVDTTDLNVVAPSQTATTGDQSVNFDAERIPVASAYTAALAASAEACMGSSSAAGQGIGFGVSFGTTWENEKCNARKDAAVWISLNERAVAIARMRQVAVNDSAYLAVYAGAQPLNVASSAQQKPWATSGDSAKH